MDNISHTAVYPSASPGNGGSGGNKGEGNKGNSSLGKNKPEVTKPVFIDYQYDKYEVEYDNHMVKMRDIR